MRGGLTLSVQEVGDGNGVLRVSFDGLSLEDVLNSVDLRARAHVLLAESLDVVADVGVLLHTVSSSTHGTRWGDERRTSCSARGTFLSFILWTPAWAEPSMAPAARSMEPFMIAVMKLQLL